MIAQRFALLFRLKRSVGYQKGPQPIYLRITVNGKRVEFSTQRQCEPNRWNAAMGRAAGTREDSRILNTYLDTLQLKVFEGYQALLQAGAAVTAEAIKARLLGSGERPRMILDIFAAHNEKLDALVGYEYAPQTIRRYQTALAHTREFIQWKYGVADLALNQLNYEFIADYEFYLKSVRKCAHNSAMKYLANFKKIVRLCVKCGWLAKDPFYGFSLSTKEVVRDILSQQELDRLWQKDFTTERLRITRDVFLFSCYTGLAYVDVAGLQRSHIAPGVDGSWWILSCRQKTQTPFRIPLLPVPLTILEHYREHPVCVARDRVLPVWSNQKLNEYLKEIAEVCGIQKKLTYHMARHTFATTVTLNNGVPIESVSKMLGHKNLKITQVYAKVLDRKISEDMSPLQIKYQKL